jgi:hypothetical protein
MPTFFIGLMEVRVIHNKTGEAVHVSSFSKENEDLLDVWDDYLAKTADTGGVATKDRYFVPERSTLFPALRQARAQFDYGRHGTDRRVRDSTSGSHVGDVARHQVASDTLRSLLVVPEHGRLAVLALESVGNASVAGMLSDHFKRWFQREFKGYRVELRYLDEPVAWSQFLDGADLRELSVTRYRPAHQNRAGRPTVEEFTVRPVRGQMLPSSWLKEMLGGRVRATDLLSVPIDDADETKLLVRSGGRDRTITVGQEWPRFKWEVDPENEGRPSDAVFYGVAEELLDATIERLAADPASAS